MPPPMMPTIIGSTTVSANSAAIAASIALPPAASISAPAAEASGWLVTTMPRLPGRRLLLAFENGAGAITPIDRSCFFSLLLSAVVSVWAESADTAIATPL